MCVMQRCPSYWCKDNSVHGYCNVDNEPFAHFNYVINRKILIDMIHESEGLF